MKINPSADDEIFNEAVANMNNQNFQIAIDGFNKCIASKKNTLKSYKIRSQALFYGNKYQSAITSYQQMIDNFPNSEDGYYGKALSLAMMGENSEVENLFQKALQINAKNWKIYFVRGFTSLKQRKLDQSLSMFEQAITKNNLNDPICYIAQAEAFCHKKKFQSARKSISYAKKALEDQTNHRLLYQFQIKKLHECLQQYEKDLKNLIELEKNNKIKSTARGDVETSLTRQLCTSIMTNNPVVFRQFSQKMSNVSTDQNFLMNIQGTGIEIQKEKQSSICECKFCQIF